MSEVPPNVRGPSSEEIDEIAARYHFELTDDERAHVETILDDILEQYERLDELDAPTPTVEYTDRDAGYRPGEDEDPLNAIVTKCRVEGATGGPLAGVEIGLKDNVAVAGVEMTAGSKLLEGFVPNTDATIVTRLLDAGADITAKLNMEDMAASGSGEWSATGPVLNPYDPDHLPGGSSSGSAAAVAAGDVDVAIGGDQAGSIRIPAAYSGIVGLKPTHTLVPYTGIMGLGWTFDHTGPMTTSVDDAGMVLDAIAGKDPLDPRQGAVETQSYTDLSSDPADLTVGVLDEGFGHEESESGVDETVSEALDELADAGADVREVSVPMHVDGQTVWLGIGTEAIAATIDGEGTGKFGKGYYDTQLMDAFGKARRAHADDFPATIKTDLILGQYLSDQYRSHYYGKAQNLARLLTEKYDEALADIDVLALPTLPNTAPEVEDDLSFVEIMGRARNMLRNTSPFDVTGHPAISVPCGTSDDLPVGVMFVGERFDDRTVLEAGAAYESISDWDAF